MKIINMYNRTHTYIKHINGYHSFSHHSSCVCSFLFNSDGTHSTMFIWNNMGKSLFMAVLKSLVYNFSFSILFLMKTIVCKHITFDFRDYGYSQYNGVSAFEFGDVILKIQKNYKQKPCQYGQRDCLKFLPRNIYCQATIAKSGKQKGTLIPQYYDIIDRSIYLRILIAINIIINYLHNHNFTYVCSCTNKHQKPVKNM